MLDKLNWNLFSKYRNELFGLSVIEIIILHFCEDVTSSNALGGVIFKFSQLYAWLFSSIGVDVFLFLSGMGLFYSLKKNFNIKSFYYNRLKRLLVPYLILALVYWIYVDLIYKDTGIMQFIGDIFLITFWTEGNTHFWYVAFIILCYLCYPLLFKAFSDEKKANIRFILISCVYVVILIAVSVIFPEWYSDTEIAVTRFWVFLFGSWAAPLVYNKKIIKFAPLMAFGIIARLAALSTRFIGGGIQGIFNISYPLNRWVISWCAVGIMLVCVILMEILKNEKIGRFLSLTGKYSLELYIVHVSVRTIMNYNGFHTYYIYNYIIMIIISIIISLILNLLSNRIIKLLPVGSKS